MTVQRNDPCPCGSGKKYKSCCMRKPGGGAPAAPPAPATTPAKTDLLTQARSLHGQPEAAIRLYRQVLEKKPKELAALMGLGQLLHERGDTEEAAALMERAVNAGARQPANYVQLSLLQSNLGRNLESRASARQALRLDPKSVRAHCLVAMAEERLNNLDEAMAAARRAVAINPDMEEAVQVLARMLRRKGDLAGAREQLETLLARPPKSSSRSATWYELAFVCDRSGDHAAAWNAMCRAGEDTRRDVGFDRHDASLPARRIAAYRRGLSADLVRRWDPATLDDGLPAPRFLVGFPRSGTTMTEQILAAHPAVITSDEQPLFLAVIDALVARTGDLADLTTALADLDIDAVRELRAVYWKQARALFGAAIDDKVLVDKNPMNILDIGLINYLFPEARALVVIRDPRDVCLSCLMQHFGLNPSNVNFLTLEDTCALYADAMSLWQEQREMLAMQILEVRYEDIVSDLEPNARRILAFMGLDWDDAALRFHEKARERHIATPSYTTVGRKVSRGAIGRWHGYREQFALHRATLAPFVQAFGYSDG